MVRGIPSCVTSEQPARSALIGTRSLDVSMSLLPQMPARFEFISFDSRQRTLAATIGLKVAP